MMLRVYMRPGKGYNFHIHSNDHQISILVEAGANEGQIFGKAEKIPAKAGTRGSVGFTAFSKKTFIHRSTNTADGPFNDRHRACFKPGPRQLHAAGARCSGLSAAVRQRRVRGWRLQLPPGETAGPITQTAPGLRVIIDGDELVEIIKGEMDRPLALRPGDFYWQEPGATRSIRNSGSSAIDLVEFELK